MNLEENITIPEISSNNENTIENQISDDLEITNTNNENIANEAGKVIEVTETTFEEEVLKSDKTVLIDFYADWCGPCKILSPIIEEVAKENPDLKVVKIDVDKNESLAYEYRAYSIPTLVVIENGVEVNRAVGAIPKKDVLELIK
ncbi:MAG: thioredoxin [Clostridia bacterium]|nr:thioredoxin [Clostridia bacterium]